MKPLEEFSIYCVTEAKVNKVNQIYLNDRWMQFNFISAESHVSCHLFAWTQMILKWYKMQQQMNKFGITQIEQ